MQALLYSFLMYICYRKCICSSCTWAVHGTIQAASDASSLQYASETMRNESAAQLSLKCVKPVHRNNMGPWFQVMTGMRFHLVGQDPSGQGTWLSHRKLWVGKRFSLIHWFNQLFWPCNMVQETSQHLRHRCERKTSQHPAICGPRTGAPGSALRHIGEQLQRFVSPIRPRS